ncbi:hypothetical protein ANN_14704, partial [Periplaneta americana]
LNLPDYFLWSYRKELVYRVIPENEEYRTARLHAAVNTFRGDEVRRANLDVVRRERRCLEMDVGILSIF